MPEAEKKLEPKRVEDFASLYSNNVYFESSEWDLKMIFGQLNQVESVIEQHSAITMPWSEAKITAYYLLVNVIFREAKIPIQLSPGVVPARPDPSDREVTPDKKALVEYMAWVHNQFFGPNPFVPRGGD